MTGWYGILQQSMFENRVELVYAIKGPSTPDGQASIGFSKNELPRPAFGAGVKGASRSALHGWAQHSPLENVEGHLVTRSKAVPWHRHARTLQPCHLDNLHNKNSIAAMTLHHSRFASHRNVCDSADSEAHFGSADVPSEKRTERKLL
jgi:hypothetical protein